MCIVSHAHGVTCTCCVCSRSVRSDRILNHPYALVLLDKHVGAQRARGLDEAALPDAKGEPVALAGACCVSVTCGCGSGGVHATLPEFYDLYKALPCPSGLYDEVRAVQEV